MTWPPPYETHPLDRAWAALDPAVQRQQASAEARAFYRQPCREYRSVDADEAVAALVEAVINTTRGASASHRRRMITSR